MSGTKVKNEHVRVRTRWLDRQVAHARMKKMGIPQVNKKKKGAPSYFSQHWKEVTAKRMAHM